MPCQHLATVPNNPVAQMMVENHWAMLGKFQCRWFLKKKSKTYEVSDSETSGQSKAFTRNSFFMWGVAIRPEGWELCLVTGSKHQVNTCWKHCWNLNTCAKKNSQNFGDLMAILKQHLGELGWMHLMILTIHGLIFRKIRKLKSSVKTSLTARLSLQNTEK